MIAKVDDLETEVTATRGLVGDPGERDVGEPGGTSAGNDDYRVLDGL
jgi:hypothetical protein